MRLRALAILAAVLAAGAIGAWVWLGKEASLPPVSIKPESPAAEQLAKTAPGTGVLSPPAPSTPDNGPDSLPQPAAPPAPVQMTSSVMPGMPMVRSTPAPRPPLAVAPASARGTVSRPDPETEGKSEVEKVQTMLRDFRTRMGENPVGSNAEIMRAVMGGNPAKARLGPPEGQSINEQGELVDRWGTPYFFHQLGKDSMEIRSAGPDRVMWTPDDLITK